MNQYQSMAWELGIPVLIWSKRREYTSQSAGAGSPWEWRYNHWEMKKYSFPTSNRHALNCMKLMGGWVSAWLWHRQCGRTGARGQALPGGRHPAFVCFALTLLLVITHVCSGNSTDITLRDPWPFPLCLKPTSVCSNAIPHLSTDHVCARQR